jgi:predicted AAA+ superfamily ATPase
MPGLPVVAAGSLLEFALNDHSGSMPVGRVRFANLEPLGFEEFLSAWKQEPLLEELRRWRPGTPVDPTVHREATRWMDLFSMVGGMPGIVDAALRSDGLENLRDEQRQLVATYRADFPKYAGRIAGDTMDAVLRSVAGQLGQKFVYSRVENARKQHHVKAALERLVHARLLTFVRYSSGNGVPLSAETKDKFRKVAFQDVCVLHALLETPAGEMDDLVPSTRARIREQMTIQQLRLFGSPEGDLRELFYWQREGGRPGEIDHLVQLRGQVIPIELKSGASGSMKSLHQFMYDKRHALAVRIDSNPPSLLPIDVKTTQGNQVRYRLLNLPHHLLFNLERILETL